MEERTVLDVERIIGIDISKKDFTSCTLLKEEKYAKRHIVKPTITKKNKSGKSEKKSVPDHQMSGKGRFLFISQLRKGDLVALEGGTSSANFARGILENSEAEVVLLNPGKLHNYLKSMNKSDAKDAMKIAEYIRDVTPSSWCNIPVPTEEESTERSLLKQQINTKKLRTSVINQLHGIFNEYGFPNVTKANLKKENTRLELIVKSFEDGSEIRILAEMLNSLICKYDDMLKILEGLIAETILERHPEETVAWMSMHRVGPLTAAACIAYAGDCTRFSKPAQFRNYVGLIPYKSQSGTSVNFTGGVVAYGCMPIRRNVMQAAWGSIQTGAAKRKLFEEEGIVSHYNRFEDIYLENKAKGKKGQTIAVKIANKILTTGWTLVRSGQLWHECDINALNKKLKTNKIRIKIKAIDEGCHPILEGSND